MFRGGAIYEFERKKKDSSTRKVPYKRQTHNFLTMTTIFISEQKKKILFLQNFPLPPSNRKKKIVNLRESKRKIFDELNKKKKKLFQTLPLIL